MEYGDITIKRFLLYIKEIDRMHKKIENRDKRLTFCILGATIRLNQISNTLTLMSLKASRFGWLFCFLLTMLNCKYQKSVYR